MGRQGFTPFSSSPKTRLLRFLERGSILLLPPSASDERERRGSLGETPSISFFFVASQEAGSRVTEMGRIAGLSDSGKGSLLQTSDRGRVPEMVEDRAGRVN